MRINKEDYLVLDINADVVKITSSLKVAEKFVEMENWGIEKESRFMIVKVVDIKGFVDKKLRSYSRLEVSPENGD